ncbi:hypothetical protein GDO78_021591 [Eleutherodactylus coqui]|uniref:Uncharacterized protein n=1 Tax=Eleutherodactylus coqui TaxID=57060 RepID=A0A8J6B8X7_ELECQ|nr:hypothetical protein GDO78_021591 [Eleutherodactylus coqui]
MDKDREKMSEAILNLTLEIVHLLTGEECMVVKKTSGESVTPGYRPHASRGWSKTKSPITGRELHSLIHVRKNKQKILQLINKMIELLNEEGAAKHLSLEKWKYREGHRDLYKNDLSENQQPLASPGGSSSKNTPERCSTPLYSQDCPEDNQVIGGERPPDVEKPSGSCVY